MSRSPLLAVALGALKGGVDVRAQKKADALAARQQQQQDLATELQLRSMPGVSLEDTAAVRQQLDPKVLGPLLSTASAGIASGVGLPAPTAPKGEDAGEVSLGGRRLNVRFDPTDTVAGRAKSERTRSVTQWQTVTNPRTKQPFTAEEADLLAAGKAKYSDFKPEVAPHIDPLSPEGIAASGKRAGAEAAAKKPYERAPAEPLQVVQDKDGNFVVINKKSGTTSDTGVVGAQKSGGSGGQAARAAAAAVPELKAAGAIIDKFDDPTVMSQLSKKAGLLGNYLNTPEGRQLNQAITQFVTLSELAKGNKRPTDAMMHRFHEIYAPTPGDDPATRAQKKQARATLIESVSALSGQSHGSTSTAKKGAAPDAVIDDALAKNGGDAAKAHAYLVSQGYD